MKLIQRAFRSDDKKHLVTEKKKRTLFNYVNQRTTQTHGIISQFKCLNVKRFDNVMSLICFLLGVHKIYDYANNFFLIFLHDFK